MLKPANSTEQFQPNPGDQNSSDGQIIHKACKLKIGQGGFLPSEGCLLHIPSHAPGRTCSPPPHLQSESNFVFIIIIPIITIIIISYTIITTPMNLQYESHVIHEQNDKKPSCKLTQWTQRGLLHILDNHHRHHYCYHIQECDLNHHPHHHHEHDHHCQPPHQGNKEVGVADLTLVLIVLLIFPSTAGQVQTLAHLQHNRFKWQKSKKEAF